MYTALVRKEENMFVATCPEIGTVSQGKSVSDAVKNLKEATELYVKEFPSKSQPIVKQFEVETIAKAS